MKKRKAKSKPAGNSKPKSKHKNTAKDRRYRENMKSTGFTRVHVFVHRDDAAKIREIARELREKKMADVSSES